MHTYCILIRTHPCQFTKANLLEDSISKDSDEFKDFYAYHQSTKKTFILKSLKNMYLCKCSSLVMIYYSWIWNRLPEMVLTEPILSQYSSSLKKKAGRKEGRKIRWIHFKYKSETVILISDILELQTKLELMFWWKKLEVIHDF